MNIKATKDYCRSLAGVSEKEFAAPSHVLVFYVGDKQFAYFKTSQPEQWRFSIRVAAERFLELTDQAGIKPARYMQRFHWISIVNIELHETDLIKTLIDGSYQKALSSLSKKAQLIITQPKS
ncbi:MmcQ/YjbR family DNA-binding protein [Iodobacter arcticus]|uniref:MmcQ/YjbR family DNA-binding protein n=1 Tax=Iodobacter arcticus TaxID=590593 RepID=A0ABW2QYS7_9NEIS